MKVIFHKEAEREFREAIQYYTEIDPALGADFEAKIEEGVALAMAFPSLWRQMSRGVRRSLVRRFPYGIIYSYDEDIFYILAIMHLHQEPGYWEDRL